MRRALSLLALLAFAACELPQGCEPAAVEPDTGNLDRVADLALVTPPGQDAPERSFLVLANPELESLRVFDTFDATFVRGPNVYFPLSIPVGPATYRVAAPLGDPSRVYALDSALDRIFVVRTTSEGDAPAFTRVGEGVPTGRAPGDLAVLASEERALAFVTLPDAGVLQVLEIDPEAGTGEEVARVDLGEGARPSQVALHPTGDAAVVTDAALSSVAVVRTEDLALDRRLEVGGPTGAVTTGRVDVGDGIAPVALVLREEAAEVVALRLFRPGYREPRYAVLGAAELPSFPTAAFVPDAEAETEADLPVCCATVDERGQTTRSWAAVATATGSLFYLRLDPAPGDERPLVRPVTARAPSPGVRELPEGTEAWQPASGGEGRRPELVVEATDNLGDPPRFPYHPADLRFTLTFGGRPPGARGRTGTFDDGAVTALPDGSGLTLEAQDVLPGDLLVADTEGRGVRCPDVVEAFIGSVDGDTLTLEGLDDQAAACLAQGGEVVFDVFAEGAFLVESNAEGYLGRFPLEAGGQSTSFEVPGFVITVTAHPAGPPLRGSVLLVPVTQGLSLVELRLSREREVATATEGFSTSALLPLAMTGGPIQVRDDAPNEGDPGFFAVRRMFLSTAGGRLFELNHAETYINRVAAYR